MVSDKRIEMASEFAPFDFYRQRFPSQMAPIYGRFVGHAHDRFQTSEPTAIEEIIVLPSRSWAIKSPSIEVLAFGSFRKSATTIMRLANILTPIYMEMNLLPIVRPVLRREWYLAELRQSPVFQKIRGLGFTAYNTSVSNE